MLAIFQTSNERLTMLIIAYVFYLFFGALVFDACESPHEAKVIGDLNDYVRRFRSRHNACLTDAQLNDFIRLVSFDNDRGVSAIRNVSKEPNWSFGQAVFFSGTVLTTIGYGNVYPQTGLGKVFCIAYAIVGIPATLLLLYAIIERLMTVTSIVLEFYIEFMQPVLNRFARQRLQRPHMHVMFSFLCALAVFVLFFLVPTGIYSHIEAWSYLDAFYYCFISLSTVGLGDYVPGDSEAQSHRHLYKICSIMYLIVGVMVMVWLLEIFSQTPELNFYKYFSLSKDGILTNHQDTMHQASSVSANASSVFSPAKSLFSPNDSGVAYQHQRNDSGLKATPYDPIRSQESAGGSAGAVNDDELILKNAATSQNNYSSLSDVTRN